MYLEEKTSINQMKTNSFYMDQLHSQTKYISFRKRALKIKTIMSVLADFFRIRRIGFARFRVRLKAVFNKKTIEDYELSYSYDHSFEIDYSSNNKPTHRIAVYTSIFGNYDPLCEPLYVSPYCDYYAITDQTIPSDSVWKAIDTSSIEGFSNLDNYHKSKYCKMFPHILFPEYDCSIWVDGNVQIVADLFPLYDRIPETHIIGMFQNPKHNCIYTESSYNVFLGNVNTKQMKRQIETYKKEGFPKQFGLREFSIIVRKHHDPICIKLMNDWWTQVNTFTMRDQISFPYVLWKNGLTIDYVFLLGSNWRWNPRFICYPHNWHIRFRNDK